MLEKQPGSSSSADPAPVCRLSWKVPDPFELYGPEQHGCGSPASKPHTKENFLLENSDCVLLPVTVGCG